jgi:hypothetical protein
MQANELLSLFAGFIIASFLIWCVTALEQIKVPTYKGHQQKAKKSVDLGTGGRQHPWNVSSFFHTPVAAPP